MDGNLVSHAPVLVTCLSQRVSSAGDSDMAYSSSVCASCTWRRRISPLPSCRIMAWSPVLNAVFPWRSGNRFPVTTHEAVRLSQEERVRLGIAIPICLTGRRVIHYIGTLEVAPWKRAVRENIIGPPPPGGTTPRCEGWRSRNNSTPAGDTFVDQHNISAGVEAPPRLLTSPTCFHFDVYTHDILACKADVSHCKFSQ